MVQPTIEAKFNEYGMPNTETSTPIYDKKLPLPMTTKKTVLRDLQNEKRITMPNSVDNSSFLKKNRPEIEPVKASTPKKTDPEHVNNSQSKPINTAHGHLVYVRRKPEESPKSNIRVTSRDNSYCSPPRKVGDQQRTTEEKLVGNESPVCIPEIAPTVKCPLTSFPSGKPTVPSSLEKSPNNLQTVGADTRALSVSITPSEYPKSVNTQYWEERYCQLQDFLEMLDRSDQENYVQMLRSLSPEGLNSQAIALEKRSIQLTLEEAKELQRVQQLDVLGTYAKNSRAPAAQ